jgi:hypothetical protein
MNKQIELVSGGGNDISNNIIMPLNLKANLPIINKPFDINNAPIITQYKEQLSMNEIIERLKQNRHTDNDNLPTILPAWTYNEPPLVQLGPESRNIKENRKTRRKSRRKNTEHRPSH